MMSSSSASEGPAGSLSIDEAQIRSRYQEAGQGHVLQYIDKLSSEDKDKLLRQLQDIQVETIAALLDAAKNDSSSNSSSSNSDAPITPFSKHIGRTTDKEATENAYQMGMEALAQGQVAALVLAGGQGTRLGFDGPKGCYNIELPSGKSLFQLLCERLLKLKALASRNNAPSRIPFYIMTSPINHQETVSYFAKHNYFGLPKEDVLFFEQSMLPCLTEEHGNIILETPSQVAMAPDGNGGIYPSLSKSGMLDNMTQRNIHYLHVFSIDNVLTKIVDPTFIGFCINQKADCGNKVVWKVGPHEKVGVIAEKNGKPCVVEYSEISTEMAERVHDTSGRLLFGAANICNHFYTLDFLCNKVMPQLGNLYHIAHKKIAHWDESAQQTVVPDTNNGIKLESFIFDIFPLSERMAILEVPREDEFSPVKNAPGGTNDSPDTARQHVSQQAKRWVTAAGGQLKEKDNNNDICEISPLTSYGGEGLDDLVQGKDIECPFQL